MIHPIHGIIITTRDAPSLSCIGVSPFHLLPPSPIAQARRPAVSRVFASQQKKTICIGFGWGEHSDSRLIQVESLMERLDGLGPSHSSHRARVTIRGPASSYVGVRVACFLTS